MLTKRFCVLNRQQSEVRAKMTTRNLTSTFAPPRKVHFLAILLTGCLLMVAVAEPLVRSPGESSSEGCRLENRPEGVKAVCSNLTLTEIPQDLPRDTITLLASDNLIRNLTNNSFDILKQLVFLFVDGNLINHLDVGTFWPLTRLRLLNMAKNHLTQLPNYIFHSNLLLRQVVLSNNCFSSVPTFALASVEQLQSILLSQNKIQKPDFTAFYHLNNISDIDMSSNEISSLQASDFKPLQNSSVKRLSLARNTFVQLPHGVFSYLYRADVLDLTGNVLREFHVDSFLGNMDIIKLSVWSCRIETIVPLNIFNLSDKAIPSVDFIELTGNRINSIPRNAFFGFTRTRILNISQNKIWNVTNSSFCGLDSLIHLDISKNQIIFLPPRMFSCNPKLQELIISHNDLLILNPLSFKGLPVLHKLDLSSNHLKGVSNSYWNNSALHFLDISYNLYSSIKGYMFKGDLTSLSFLDISYNVIQTFSKNTFYNVPSLQVLYLKGMSSIVNRLNEVFSQMMNLTKLDLSSTDISFDSFYQFTNTSSLKELRMQKNNLESADFFDNALNISVFDGLVSLKKLNLRENNLNSLEPGVFSPLRELQLLDLSRSCIVILKPGVFSGLTSLWRLYLQDNSIVTASATSFTGLDNLGLLFLNNNKLRTLDKNTFVATPNLRNLHLSYNRLSEVQRGTFFPTNKTLLIDVSGNPFSCTCALSWFRTWLVESNTIFLNLDKTMCSRRSIKAVIYRPILMFDPVDFCGINIIPITALCLVACTVSLISITLYLKRYWLNHKFVLLKLAIAGSGKIVENFKASNYDFHLNLMFHDSEEEWVDEVMKPVLEKRFPHLHNIVYGDENLRLEMFYINALYDAIENSFKTVLLLSNQSIYDIWTMTKLRLALEHVNETGLDKVILIFVDDIEDDNMPGLVRLFLSKNKTHLWWTDDEDERDLFWTHFERSMKANRAITNIPL